MWLVDKAHGETPRQEPEWPEWYLVRDDELKGAPYLIAVYGDGTEIGPYPIALPQP